jgi:hypothetical protein
MNATDVSPTRFEVARRSVQTLINSMSGGAQMTIILVGATPQALISGESDQTLLSAALASAKATQGGADWQATFALAAGAAHGAQDVTSVIVSDGGLPESGLPALPGQIRYVPVGKTADNLALSALALRARQLFAKVTNYGGAERSVLLSLYLNDELLSARPLQLKAGASQSLTIDDLPETPGVYRMHISDPLGQPLDALALDDSAFAVNQQASTRRVLLVSKGNLYLEQLLASLPGLQPFRALPAADGSLQIPAEPFDLYVLDGILPATLPAGNLLMINPPANPLFNVGLPFKDMSDIQVHDDPLTRSVDWSGVHILQAKTITPPDWATVLIEAKSGPLVFAGETGGRRVAALSFDLRESDLPLQVAYPILFTNLINYLVPPTAFDATQSLQPNESLTIVPPPGVERIVIASPSNQAYSLLPSAARLTFTETDQTGYYAVNFISKTATKTEYFVVNLFDTAESDIKPRQSLQIGRSAVTPAAANRVGLREIWPWLAGLALLILLVEWQVFHRRVIWPLRRESQKGLK